MAKEHVVLLIDALDESDNAELAVGNNVLQLPSYLPKGVFVILTARPLYDLKLVVDHRKDLFIEENDPHNKTDVRRFIQQYILDRLELFSKKLEAWQLNTDAFIQLLLEKSEGNFMYLVHVLDDIRSGIINLDDTNDIHNLPKGLQAYYRRHWREMTQRDIDRLSKYYEPVVCMFATALEAVPVNQVIEWTRRKWPELTPFLIQEVIREWRPFLNEDFVGHLTLYRLYHASFKDFLNNEIGLYLYNEQIIETAFQKILP